MVPEWPYSSLEVIRAIRVISVIRVIRVIGVINLQRKTEIYRLAVKLKISKGGCGSLPAHHHYKSSCRS